MNHAFAQMLAQSPEPVTQLGGGLVIWVVVLAGLALMPFVLTMVTSFAKLVIVGGIIRQALGTQQVPPNTVITGLALILTVHVMWPVAQQAAAAYQAPSETKIAATGKAARDSEEQKQAVLSALRASKEPIAEFLRRNSDRRHIRMFQSLANRPGASAQRPAAEAPQAPDPDSLDAYREILTVLTPAFVLTELSAAFKIGFIIFVPFLVIDLVVSNILLALGMQMLSPQTVTLPLKLMLFVLVDGWAVIIKGLILGYR